MILRLQVLVPTYNNPGTIESVVQDLLSQTPFPILVWDDGSDIPVRDLFRSPEVLQACAAGRVQVQRFSENRGKGLALQAAIQFSVRQGFTHLVSMDGDGQHHAREVQKLVDVAKENPRALVIGHRGLQGENVPKISRFGRKFSNFWVKYQTGTPVLDSQSGFRLYPLFSVQTMKFFTRRYDFEIEVLIRLMWKNVPVREVAIDVFYPEKKDRVSHFHKFWDNARISTLNTLLVVLALLRADASPIRKAVALGAGVWIGCTPFYGFHFLIVALIAFVFRLNAVLVLLGSQVSIPPLAPVLILSSMGIGKFVLPESHGFFRWLSGSLVLGAGLGLLTGLISYAVSVTAARNLKTGRVNWNGRSRGGVVGNGFLKLVLKFLGQRAGYFCLFFVVPYFYFFAPKAKKGLNEYWKIVRPNEGFWRRQSRILQHFYRFGQVLMDRSVQQYAKVSPFLSRPQGRENILAAVRAKSGLLMVGSHVGGWELAAKLLQQDQVPLNVYVVNYSPFTSTQQPVFQVHQVLRAGGCVGLMGDRPMSSQLELVSFFEKLVPIDVSPFRIAAATGAPLLFTFGFKGFGMNYDFSAEPARIYQYPADQSREWTCLQWAQEYAHALEKKIHQYPEQWFNFFPMWSAWPTKPDGAEILPKKCSLKEELPTSTPD